MMIYPVDRTEVRSTAPSHQVESFTPVTLPVNVISRHIQHILENFINSKHI